MKPLKLKLRGFRGIRAGMGRDEVELDLSGVVDAGLVALAGHNGSGKTTLLDNLHPYRLMPSRTSGDGFGSFSFYEHLCLPDCLKELEWEHDGIRYRSQLVFRINGKRKTEAYLHQWDEGRWVPVRVADGTRSDGKAETYDTCVQALLGSAETFFTSVFSAQSKRSLSDYKNSEIKNLLSDLLGLHSIRDLGGRANEVSRQLKAALSERRVTAAKMGDEVTQLSAQIDALGVVAARIAQQTSERAAARAGVDGARSELASREATLGAARSVEEQRARLQRELEAAVRAGAATLRAADEEVARDEQRVRTLRTTAKERQATLQRKRQALTDERDGLDQLLAAAPAIARAERRLPLALRVQQERQARAAGLSSAREDLAAAQSRCRAVAAELQSLEREAGQATLRKADLERRLGLTTRVPCSGTDLQGRCELLSDANAAKALMPQVVVDMQRMVTRQNELQDDARAGGQAVRDGQDRVAEHGRAVARARATDARVRFLERMTQSKGELELARKRYDALQLELQATEAETRLASEAVEGGEIEQAQKAVDAARARRGAAAEQCKAAEAAVREALQRLPAPVDQGAVKASADALARAEARLNVAETSYAEALRAQAHLQHLLETRQGAAARAAAEKERVATLEAEAGHWSVLARGLSNDGVIALAIDDAGPTLAGLTNDLLLACYGPRFTVSIKTEVETAKGELREGFDIVVHDATSDETKSVAVMSGGERVWVNECLTRAIALYLAQNSGRTYGALFCDEADGPLDPERKRMFMAMKREVLRLGGYGVEFFVSQTPELTAMADAVIDVESLAASNPVEALAQEGV